jgi:hypothetical protein
MQYRINKQATKEATHVVPTNHRHPAQGRTPQVQGGQVSDLLYFVIMATIMAFFLIAWRLS